MLKASWCVEIETHIWTTNHLATGESMEIGGIELNVESSICILDETLYILYEQPTSDPLLIRATYPIHFSLSHFALNQ